ncbi:MAG TPA: hypothetical protein DCS87_14730 [Rheinheimera sp.]|nr:hypothetical protein [Rheinheimera sp.]
MQHNRSVLHFSYILDRKLFVTISPFNIADFARPLTVAATPTANTADLVQQRIDSQVKTQLLKKAAVKIPSIAKRLKASKISRTSVRSAAW